MILVFLYAIGFGVAAALVPHGGAVAIAFVGWLAMGWQTMLLHKSMGYTGEWRDIALGRKEIIAKQQEIIAKQRQDLIMAAGVLFKVQKAIQEAQEEEE